MTPCNTKSIDWTWLIGGMLLFSTTVAYGDEWPIVFTDVPVPPSAYNGANREAPTFDCQPEFFDPLKNWYRKVEISGLVNRNSSSPDIYEIQGEDEAIAMEIDSWSKQGEAKTVLPEPYSLTKYMFGCASESSSVFEFKKNGVRYALYTHISQSMFSPDRRKLVLFNYVKTPKGNWQELRRIIEIATKKYSPLPMMNETTFLADISNENVVTYSMPIDSPAGQKNRRVVSIWGHDGKLIRALSAPIQTTAANAESSDDGIGVLPDESSTFYHLTRTGQNVCTLRLQDIQRPDGQRSIQLTVPSLADMPDAMSTHIQIDLAGLKLKTGAMKYRVSASGRGDVLNDWGPWLVGK
jgi:hypothetical protein